MHLSQQLWSMAVSLFLATVGITLIYISGAGSLSIGPNSKSVNLQKAIEAQQKLSNVVNQASEAVASAAHSALGLIGASQQAEALLKETAAYVSSVEATLASGNISTGDALAQTHQAMSAGKDTINDVANFLTKPGTSRPLPISNLVSRAENLSQRAANITNRADALVLIRELSEAIEQASELLSTLPNARDTNQGAQLEELNSRLNSMVSSLEGLHEGQKLIDASLQHTHQQIAVLTNQVNANQAPVNLVDHGDASWSSWFWEHMNVSNIIGLTGIFVTLLSIIHAISSSSFVVSKIKTLWTARRSGKSA